MADPRFDKNWWNIVSLNTWNHKNWERRFEVIDWWFLMIDMFWNSLIEMNVIDKIFEKIWWILLKSTKNLTKLNDLFLCGIVWIHDDLILIYGKNRVPRKFVPKITLSENQSFRRLTNDKWQKWNNVEFLWMRRLMCYCFINS